MSDKYLINLSIETFGASFRDNTREELIEIGLAIETQDLNVEDLEVIGL